MKRICLILAAITTLGFNTLAGTISKDKASRAAIRFITEQISPDLLSDVGEVAVTESFIINDQEIPLYYIFSLMPQGWIAIAANDAVFPILAYSYEGVYDENNQAPQFKAWMKQYEDQIRYAISENNSPLPETVEMWKLLTDAGCRMPDAGSDPIVPRPSSFVHRGVEPLITTHWDQSPWYNELCPGDNGSHCPAGCVPVCMAQVMYYFRWPDTGTGAYTYTEPTYGVLSADFGATTYKWNEMTTSINQSNLAIAELIYHLGISCDLQYTPTGSGMYNHKAAYSLRTYFNYAPETQYLFRDSTTLDWDSVLIAHLDKKIPMYYAGWSVPDTNGHAFVCDGYQDSLFFHFNFGWGGNSDGYFYTSDLTPGGYNFNLAQEVVINCFPDTINFTYPVQCAGGLEFTTKVGSFEDGSGPIDNYATDANCSWLIAPQTLTDSVTSITLTFDRFATNPADFVTVYDGSTTSDPVLGSYSGDLLPPELTSSGSSMLVTFVAGAQPPANGFLSHYKANMPVWCSGITTIKADSAEISDGSFDFNYYNNSLCKWKLETESGDPLTIYFEYFDTEAGHDFLTIFDLATGDTLVSLSGEYTSGNLPDSVTSPSGKMFLIFMTNSSITSNGWKIYYPKKSNIGITEKSGIRQISLFPNPANDLVTIEFKTTFPQSIKIEVMDVNGRIRLFDHAEATSGMSQTKIDVKMLPAGVYFLHITGNMETIVKKLIIN